MWKVAIVDDEPATRDGLLRHVPWESLGITQVEAAEDAVRMLALCERMRPDIVISDVRMPGMDGIALCRKLRALYPKCRIIFLSGYSDKAYLLSAIEISAVSYVEKPVDIDRLVCVLRRAVNECAELSQQTHDIVEPAAIARFMAAQAGGSRDAVLEAAGMIQAAVGARQVASLAALAACIFSLPFSWHSADSRPLTPKRTRRRCTLRWNNARTPQRCTRI